MKHNIPDAGTAQWRKNEKIINENPVLKKARDTAEGFKPKSGSTHGGKGSATRPTDKSAYDAGWDRIFGKKD